uniref:Uncharacterized protein n=1 Tax=Knipowitschia caucasica TaxID=637954 RepID=A0AAV2K110_KNICA
MMRNTFAPEKREEESAEPSPHPASMLRPHHATLTSLLPGSSAASLALNNRLPSVTTLGTGCGGVDAERRDPATEGGSGLGLILGSVAVVWL